MKQSWAPIFLASSFLVLVATAACGGGSGANRQLQSIVANASGIIQIQLTATGTFTSSPSSVTPLPVSWYVIPSGEDPPFSYALTSRPLAAGCSTGSEAIALAPANPSAAMNGPIPAQVFEDLVTKHTTTSEGGFVASPPLNLACP